MKRLLRMAGGGRASVAAVGRRLPGDSASWGPVRRRCDEVAAWLAGRDEAAGRLVELTAERRTRREAPEHADAAIAARFAGMSEGRIKARRVIELRNARVWGVDYGALITPDDGLVREFSPAIADFCTDRIDPAAHGAWRRATLPRMSALPGRTLALHGFGGENFHHWLLDTLPGVAQVEEAGYGLGGFDHVAVFGAGSAFQRETWARLGVEAARIVRLEEGVHFRSGSVVVPAFAEPGRQPEKYDYTPEGLALARRLFWPVGRTAEAGAGAFRRLVVSREKATCRRLEQGERLHARLAREGFLKVCLEDHTVAEQAAMFAAAETILMPTGGGLANLVFCRPGTRVIELFPPSYLPTFSLPLTQALGLRYTALVGEVPAGSEPRHDDEGKFVDIRVAEEKLLGHALGGGGG